MVIDGFWVAIFGLFAVMAIVRFSAYLNERRWARERQAEEDAAKRAAE